MRLPYVSLGVPSRLRLVVLAARDLCCDPNLQELVKSTLRSALLALNSLRRALAVQVRCKSLSLHAPTACGARITATCTATPLAVLDRMRVSFAGAFTKDTGEARPRPVARKTPSRQFSSDSTPSRISSSGSNSDADLASNVYRSLSLTVSEADDETMASKRGALEVEKLLLENAIDDSNDDVVAARRCSTRLREVMALLEEVTLAEEALAECNTRPRAMSTAEKRAAEKRRLSRRQSRNEAKRHAPTP